MYDITYSHREHYSSLEPGISVEVTLRVDRNDEVRVRAKLDSGANNCIFQRQYADMLGLVFENGERRTFSTATGSFVGFGHTVEVETAGLKTDALVYFAEIPRNVLGLQGWFDRFRVGFDHYESAFYRARSG